MEVPGRAGYDSERFEKAEDIGDLLLNQTKATWDVAFKAGYEQGWNENKPYLPDANEPWDREHTVFEDGKQAGRKEVVEWIEEHALREQAVLGDNRILLAVDWTDKITEWGL